MAEDDLNADRLEEDWNHALDAADEAVQAGGRSQALPSSEAAAGAEHVREERRWLSGFRPALHRLFPRRR